MNPNPMEGDANKWEDENSDGGPSLSVDTEKWPHNIIFLQNTPNIWLIVLFFKRKNTCLLLERGFIRMYCKIIFFFSNLPITYNFIKLITQKQIIIETKIESPLNTHVCLYIYIYIYIYNVYIYVDNYVIQTCTLLSCPVHVK